MSHPILPRHPLDGPDIVKIALGQAASEAFRSVGEHFLVIATKADCTAPEALRGRIVLYCQPCTKDQLDGAYRVATGKARAVKIKLPLSKS